MPLFVRSVLKNSWLSAEEISRSLQTLASTNEIVLRGELAVDATWWRATVSKAVTAVDTEHKMHPDRAGLDLMRLRKMLALDSQQVFDALLADLAAEGIERSGDVVRRSSHRASLPPALQKIANDIRTALAVKSFDPPSRRDLTATAEAKQALRFLIQSNEVLEINEEVVLLRDAFLQNARRNRQFNPRKRRGDGGGVAAGTEQLAARDGAFSRATRSRRRYAASRRPRMLAALDFLRSKDCFGIASRYATGGDPTEATEKCA